MPEETPDEARRRRNRERVARWRAANPERAREHDRRDYERHRERRLAYEADPERRRKKAERMRAARAADPELARLKFRAWSYGLTVGHLRELLAGGCDVCGTTERLHVDHDHRCCPPGRSPRSCGRCVRGVLCNGCNTAMGLLGESEQRVLALLDHLRRRPAAEGPLSP